MRATRKILARHRGSIKAISLLGRARGAGYSGPFEAGCGNPPATRARMLNLLRVLRFP